MMRTTKWLLLAMLLLPTLAMCQTTVNITVTDTPDNQTWNNGTYAAQLVGASSPSAPSNPSGTFTLLGGGGSISPQSGSLSGTGTASIALPANANVAPLSQWRISVCPQVTSACFTQLVTVNITSPQTLTMTPPSPRINLQTTPPPVTAYSTGEIVGAAIGSTIYLIGTGPQVCSAVSGNLCTTWASAGGTNAVPNDQRWYLMRTGQGGCGSLTNCTAVFADTQYVNDATSNSTTTVTCPNNDCNFVAGDVGKTAWAVTNGGVSTVGIAVNSNIVCPTTTIQTVNSAQSVTLNNACTTSGAGNTVFVWGHRDGTILHGIDGSGVGCVWIVPPTTAGGALMIDQAIFITSPSCAQQEAFLSKSWGGLYGNFSIIMTPDFNWATCTGNGGAHTGSNVCIGTGLTQMNNTFIWGNGSIPSSNANCANGSGKTVLALAPSGGGMTSTNMTGVCSGETGEGVELNSLDENWIGGGAQFSMTQPCVVSSVVFTEVLDCRNDNVDSTYGMSIVSGGFDTDVSSTPMNSVVIFTGGTMNSRGTHFYQNTINNCALQVQGTWISYGDFVNSDANFGNGLNGLCFSAGGSAQIGNTIFKGTTNAIQFTGGTLTSIGGNTVIGPSPVTFATTPPAGIVGWDVLQGSCTGTVTSASTIGLFNLGNNTTTTCTSTTTNIGPVLGKAGNVYALSCSAGTAGNQAADACTVLKNNVATSMTCSLNGVTGCLDGATAHQFTYAIGDIITVKVVSGTSTTLANVKASVMAW